LSPLTGLHAAVTGSSRGIGAAIASELARQGATVSLMARSKDELERLAAELREAHGGAAGAVVCDVSDSGSVRSAFARAIAERGPVQVLVNNAGAAVSQSFALTTRDVWDEMLAVNLTSAYACTTEVLPAMIAARSGRIINIASTAGLRGFRTMTAYCAAKHGLVGFTRALALETAKHGITVNAVCPGYTDTAIAESAVTNIVERMGRTEDEARAMIVRTIPRGRLTTPDEVAATVAWLCSPAAAAVTGVALPVDGGESV